MPPSSFTWLDTSERDRRRAMRVIDLLRQQGTLDELGIGTVRDALADTLAPGTSTIQTRARYFLFIPWMYQQLEKKRIHSDRIAERGRKREIDLAACLAECEDSLGAIGQDSGKSLRRLASEVYWAGLGILGIRLFAGSREQYHRALDRIYREEETHRGRKGESVELAPPAARWHPHLPPVPEGFPWEASFALTVDEASFLHDRIQARALDTAFAYLIANAGSVREQPGWWADPLMATYPESICAEVVHARCYSEVIHGATLLYNLMLAREYPKEELVDQFGARLAAWREQLIARDEAQAGWDRQAFWRLVYEKNGRVPAMTRRFSEDWIQLTREPGFDPSSKRAQRLVREREFRLKKRRARLHNRDYLLMWGGKSNLDPLEYRWGTVRNLVSDIQEGLGAGEGDARAA